MAARAPQARRIVRDDDVRTRAGILRGGGPCEYHPCDHSGREREGLDRLAGLSKETGLYPDLSFTRTHVSVTVYGSDGATLDAEAREFAARAEAIATLEAA